MRHFQPRRRNPSAGFAGQARDVERVIDVPVRQEDSLDRERVPAAPAQRPSQRRHATNKTGIDQIKLVFVAQDVKADKGRPDLEKIVVHAVEDRPALPWRDPNAIDLRRGPSRLDPPCANA